MRVFLVFALLTVLGASPLAAQVDRLDAVALELEAIVGDLESTQAQTTILRQRLNDLEALASDHLSTLAEQDRLLGQYQDSVAALQAHDRESLDLAQDLRAQLERERSLTAWLWPLAGAALAAAVVEGLALGWR